MVAIEEWQDPGDQGYEGADSTNDMGLNMRFAPLVAGLGGRYEVEGPASDVG